MIPNKTGQGRMAESTGIRTVEDLMQDATQGHSTSLFSVPQFPPGD
jgi:hypothetical protein